MLERSRLLDDAWFEVSVGLYRQYLQETARDQDETPVGCIAETGVYHLTVQANTKAVLRAKLHLRVFDPAGCGSLPVLSDTLAWEHLEVNGEAAALASVGNWLKFAPRAPGVYTITASATLEGPKALKKLRGLPIRRTVKTFLIFDSPGRWHVDVEGAQPRRLVGTVEKGTHGRFALPPHKMLKVKYDVPRIERQRPVRYELQGDVVWNLDAAVQQVTAHLTVTIAGGASDEIELLLPRNADRVSITGPEVREVRVDGGRAKVYLQGRRLGQTALTVSYELPQGDGNVRRLGQLGASDGHWVGGTLVVTNSAGGMEVLPGTMVGLGELALFDIPSSASAILPAPPVAAYKITSRSFSAEVEVVRLGEFALRQSIADLAHYEVFLSPDGSMMCRARYEIRNRNKQFLNLDLPEGSRLLFASVNEKPCRLSPVTEGQTRWMLPLERSRPSVMGLVSFPVEIAFVRRTDRLRAKGDAEIPLPIIDLPVAYGWCEAYIPSGMRIRKWSGGMKHVERYSSETARANLAYGMGELAAGYEQAERIRPQGRPAPGPGVPAPVAALTPIPAKPARPKDRLAATDSTSDSPSSQRQSRSDMRFGSGTVFIGGAKLNATLGTNYYRAGRDYYDKNDYVNARAALQRAIKLAPNTPEAANARRLIQNIGLVQGKLKLKSRGEKLAGRRVIGGQSLANVTLFGGQRSHIEKGFKAAREGRSEEALSQLEAAEAITGQLLVQGAEVKSTNAPMLGFRKQLGDLMQERQDRLGRLRRSIDSLKTEGKYKAALKEAKELRKHAKGVELSELQAEMEELATVEVRERAKFGEGWRHGLGGRTARR